MSKFIFNECVSGLISVLDIYGESYLRDCVEAEKQAFEFTNDLKDFKLAIRLALAVAINRVSSDLRSSLMLDFPNKHVCDGLSKRLSLLLPLL